MGSWFQAEADSLDGIIEEFGEPFVYLGFNRSKPNFPPTRDETRPPKAFCAVFERDAKDVSLGLAETRLSTRMLRVTARAADLPGLMQGDHLIHVSTGQTFEINDHRPDGLSAVELRLTQLGRQA